MTNTGLFILGRKVNLEKYCEFHGWNVPSSVELFNDLIEDLSDNNILFVHCFENSDSVYGLHLYCAVDTYELSDGLQDTELLQQFLSNKETIPNDKPYYEDFGLYTEYPYFYSYYSVY